MAGPKEVAEPHKELRFTRSAQAQVFTIAASVLLVGSLLIGIALFQGHPDLSWWIPLPPLLLAVLLLRLAFRCAQHAYLILTPLGLEIFPLFKPEKNLNLIYWNQLKGADFDENLTRLTLHYNEERTAGAVLSLKPIPEERRLLLERALLARLSA